MTIKEIEERTGLARANIRFYEQEGLITPQRRSNGYRDYSEEDEAVLLRIKLLRSLHLSLDEIKAIHGGDHTLAEALDAHMIRLEQDQEDLKRSRDLCRVMRGEGVCFETLDAQRYLTELERRINGRPPDLSADAIPRVTAPWRRLFARMLDESIYYLLWMAALGFVFNVNFMERSLLGAALDVIVVLCLNLLLEPLFLSRLGCTPGKWIFGLRVTDYDDHKLSFEQAMTRTKKVLYKGVGLHIPIWELVCMWKSRDACLKGEYLYWEDDSLLVQKDEKKSRFLLYVLAVLALNGLQYVLFEAATIPKNRGDLTVAEFAENYNDYAVFFNIFTNRSMTPGGKWEEYQQPYDVVTISFQESDTVPSYAFTYKEDSDTVPHYESTYEEDGTTITGLSFHIETEDRMAASCYRDDMHMAIRSFVQAQEDWHFFDRDLAEALAFVTEETFSDYQFTACGVEITCDFEYEGFALGGPGDEHLWAPEGTETRFSLTFSMKKIVAK